MDQSTFSEPQFSYIREDTGRHPSAYARLNRITRLQELQEELADINISYKLDDHTKSNTNKNYNISDIIITILQTNIFQRKQ